MDFQSICQRIEETYGTMSPQLKRAARHALDHPDDIALKSMRQFASKAGVQPATMVRLAQKLNLDGYASFQKPFQNRLRTRPAQSYSNSARSIQARGPDSGREMFEEMMSMDHTNLNDISETVGYETLAKCAKLISKAPKVYVAGVRGCYPAAFYFQYACSMFKNNVTLLDGRGGTFADDLRGAGKNDVVLVISFEPYSRGVVHAAEYASTHGAHIIAITDSILSPLLKGEKTTPIILQSASPAFFHSMLPVMAVVQALTLLLLAGGGKKALGELTESEIQLETFGAYWADDGTLETEDA